MGKNYFEVNPTEKVLDNILSLLRSEELNTTYSLEDIQSVLTRFQSLASSSLEGSDYPVPKKLQVRAKNTLFYHNCILLEQRKFETLAEKKLSTPTQSNSINYPIVFKINFFFFSSS